jgi:hypothetical protein
LDDLFDDPVKENRPPLAEFRKFNTTDHKFNVLKPGNELRPYQLDGLNWLAHNWHDRES